MFEKLLCSNRTLLNTLMLLIAEHLSFLGSNKCDNKAFLRGNSLKIQNVMIKSQVLNLFKNHYINNKTYL